MCYWAVNGEINLTDFPKQSLGQSVQWLTVCWATGVNFQAETVYLSVKCSSEPWIPTQPPAVCIGVQTLGRMTTCLHPISTLRLRGVLPPFPPFHLRIAVVIHCFTFTWQTKQITLITITEYINIFRGVLFTVLMSLLDTLLKTTHALHTCLTHLIGMKNIRFF